MELFTKDILSYLIHNYLDYSSIFVLSRTCKLLYSEVKKESDLFTTWKYRLEEKIINDIFSNGYIKTLEWIVKYIKRKFFFLKEKRHFKSTFDKGLPTWLDFAASKGHLNIVQFYLENFKISKKDFSTCELAAESGNFELIKLLRKEQFPWDYKTCKKAALNGHFEILKWAIENSCIINPKVLLASYNSGKLEISNFVETKLLKSYDLPNLFKSDIIFFSKAFYASVRGGNLDIVKYIFNFRNSWKNLDLTCHIAAGEGYIHIIEWAIKNGLSWNSEIYDFAARCGKMEVLIYLFQNGCPLPKSKVMDLSSSAAISGNLEILQWTLKNGFTLTLKTILNAIEFNRINILYWVIQNNKNIFNEKACSTASRKGHFEILKLLRQRGCPWDEDVTKEAVLAGHFHIYSWAKENGCPSTPQIDEIGNYLVSNFHHFSIFPCSKEKCFYCYEKEQKNYSEMDTDNDDDDDDNDNDDDDDDDNDDDDNDDDS
jgi:hypothetical protein